MTRRPRPWQRPWQLSAGPQSVPVTSTPSLHAVVTARGVEQVFLDEADARSFALDVPGSVVSSHVPRRSLEEAVVVVDRLVVVSRGTTTVDRTSRLRQFVDDPRDAPDRADVEWFDDNDGEDRHIAGFGTDEVELEARMQDAVDRARRCTGATRAVSAQ